MRPMEKLIKPNMGRLLNTNPDLHHWSYKVLGIIPWLTFMFCIVNVIVSPHTVIDLARIMAFYTMITFIFVVIFYLRGRVLVRQTEKRVQERLQGLPEKAGAKPSRVHHLVVIPNYKEPIEVLVIALQSLARQVVECPRMVVVLGMEEREPEAHTKATQLIAQFQGKFEAILATYHPANLPGEVPGKGVNESWAARQGRRVLVEKMKIPLDQILVTIADADSILHPFYFYELAHTFETIAERYTVVYHAPQLLDIKIWETNSTIRTMTYLTNAVQLSEIAHPFGLATPISTYSLSLRLLERVDYWDPVSVAEDLNILLRCFFATGGKARLYPIFLPVKSISILGKHYWQSISTYYQQKKRHAYGGTEVGYILQKWNLKAPHTPFHLKAIRLTKLVLDNLLFSTAGTVIALGTILSIILDHNAVITIPPHADPVLILVINGLSVAGVATYLVAERIRLARRRENWSIGAVGGEIISYFTFTLLTIVLAGLPALEAQTMMLFGEPLAFERTPKSIESHAGQ
jgi:cellulose synthase/poly-beta-1,6-N-acetylglucosamine synthase-like glycosyltransferase